MTEEIRPEDIIRTANPDTLTYLPKDSPQAEQAIAELKAIAGWDIRRVVPADLWDVVDDDGDPQVVISNDGLRLLAQKAEEFHPGTAAEVDRVIAAVEERGPDQ